MIGIEGVAHPERVRGHPDADRERTARAELVVTGRHELEEQEEAQHMEAADDQRHAGDAPPLASRERLGDPMPE